MRLPLLCHQAWFHKLALWLDNRRHGEQQEWPPPGRVHANAAFAPSLPMGWYRHSLSTPNQSYRKLAVFTICTNLSGKILDWRENPDTTKFYSAAYNNLQLNVNVPHLPLGGIAWSFPLYDYILIAFVVFPLHFDNVSKAYNPIKVSGFSSIFSYRETTQITKIAQNRSKSLASPRNYPQWIKTHKEQDKSRNFQLIGLPVGEFNPNSSKRKMPEPFSNNLRWQVVWIHFRTELNLSINSTMELESGVLS